MAATTAATVSERVRAALRAFPDFPKPGILFQDIFPLFSDPQLVQDVAYELARVIRDTYGRIDAVIGLDARGFLFGPMVAVGLKCAFVPVRKAGKLPGPCHAVSSSKEYGSDVQEIQQGALAEGARVIIIDDLLATGGTAVAASQLARKLGAVPLAALLLVELTDLSGRAAVEAEGVAVHSLVAM